MSKQLQICDYQGGCDNIAIWRYMPGTGKIAYCDESPGSPNYIVIYLESIE